MNFKDIKTVRNHQPQERQVFETFDLFITILATGVFLFFCYFFLANRYREFLPHSVPNVLFSLRDKYMDFFNLIVSANDLNTYQNPPGAWDSPVFLYILHFISMLFPDSISNRYVFRFMVQGKFIYLVYNFITMAIFAFSFSEIFKIFKTGIKRGIKFFIFFMLSYPVIFAFDRGNYAFLTSAIVALFMLQYLKKRTFTAAILLAVAISLKYYPAVFGIIFLIDKRWKEALTCAAVSFFLLFFSISQFQGGAFVNLKLLLDHLAFYQSVGQGVFAELAAHNNSIYMLFDVPSCLANKTCSQGSDIFVALHNQVKYIAYFLLITTSAIVCVPKLRLHDRFLLISSVLMLFPLVANDYMLPILFFPAVLWILNEPNDSVIPWLTGLCLISKRFYTLYNNGDSQTITIQSLINPVLLLTIIIYIIWLRREYIAGLFSSFRVAFNSLIKVRKLL
jgi:hypothetical protein